MLKKLRLKFVLVNMAIVICMLLVIFGLTVEHTKAEMDRESEAALQTLAFDRRVPNEDRIKIPYFEIQTNIHGDLRVTGNSYHDLTNRTFIQELLQLVYTSKESTGYLEAYQLRYVVVPNTISQRIVFVDVSGQAAALNSLIRGCFFVGLAALVVFFAISMLLARWAIKPVEKAWQQQKQFVSDASHELKTPLTVIMSNAELLQSPDFDRESKDRFADNILTVSRQMRSLVEGMLELARSDKEQSKQSFTKVDLSELVEDALLPFEPVFFENGLLLESNVASDIHVDGNREQLQQVLEILLDNAAKYSVMGIVCVNLERQGRNHCLLSVSNPGTPIPQEEAKRIFERFYRVDSARSRNGSFGLGLPIAQTIIKAHRGKIWVQSNQTGNRFCIMLPCQ